MSDRDVLRSIEVWSGRRAYFPAIGWARFLLLAILLALVLLLTGCATSTVRVITTDKAGTVTDTTTVTKGADPAALQILGTVAEIYIPRRAPIVRQEKSAVTPADLRRVLRGTPITRQEIAARWRPASSLSTEP
jgi:hypothetical protein